MGTVSASISVSLDGYFTGPNPGPGQGLGEGGEVLHGWLRGPHDREGLMSNQILAEMFHRSGAMICGRDGYDTAERAWGPKPPFQIPVFVLTHRLRPDDIREGTTFHFVTDGFEAALTRARAAAGAKNVDLHGGSVIRQALAAGALEELHLHLMPVLLGGGRRLFEGDTGPPRELSLTRVVDAPGATHLRYELPCGARD